MQIKEIQGFTARCEAKGVERDVSLFMLQHEELQLDDFVVVHLGYAIQKITPQEARTRRACAARSSWAVPIRCRHVSSSGSQ